MKKVSLIFCFSLLFAQLAFSQKTKPNIIFIYADDMGYGELGCYGQTKIKTPNIDQIAKEGIRFTDYYTSTPVCAPSRCQLLTGTHSGHSFIRGNYELGGFPDSTERGQLPLLPNTVTIGTELQKVGYTTGCIGKWGLGMGYSTGAPNKQGFDYYYGYYDQKQAHNYYPTHLWENGKWDTLNNPVINVHRRLDPKTATQEDFDYYKGKDFAIDKMGEKAIDFVKQNKDKPFFLYLPFTIPHVSLQAPDSAVAEYIGKFPETPYYGGQGYASTPYPLATYAAMITYMDSKVGEIMKLLKQLNIDDNTIVFFTSDNGTTFNGGVDAKFFESVGPYRGLKMDVYEGGIRMPMVARWPGKIKPNSETNLVAAHYDILATLLEIGKAPAVPSDGISILPTLLGKSKKQTSHEYLYWEYAEKGGQVAIRLGKWKGVKVNLIKNPKNKWELYDLVADESEKKDVAAQHPDILSQFDAIVKKEHKPSHIPKWEFVDKTLN